MSDLLGAEEQRKLYAESNQIINQRFLLTTTAITVFGAFSAFMLPKSQPVAGAAGPERMLIGGTIYLLLFYLLLFFWNRQLLTLQHAISIYLELKAKSEWEADFRRFIKKVPIGFRIQTYVFSTLGVLSVAWPIVVAKSMQLAITRRWLEVLIGAGVVYLTLIFWKGFFRKKDKRISEAWKQIIGTAPPASIALSGSAAGAPPAP